MMKPEQIKELRLALGLKSFELAEIMGVSEDTIWRWQRGDRHPTYKKMVRLNELWTEAVEKGLFRSAVPA